MNNEPKTLDETWWSHSMWEPNDEEICQIEQMRQKEMEKPVWLRNLAFYIVCNCKKCRPKYFY